jgi:cell division protein FtsL
MAAEAARVLDYGEYAPYGAGAIGAEYDEPGVEVPEESAPAVRRAPAAAAVEAAQTARGVSLFSVCGAVVVAALMVFVVLAQVKYNEVASETVRLTAQLERLTEQGKMLEIAYESAIDMKEVERYARDVLGMSKPDASQVSVIQNITEDKAEIIDPGSDGNTLRGLGDFISSLVAYFR